MKKMQWDENRREDGVEVTFVGQQTNEAVWQIETPAGDIVNECPCCGKGFLNARAARLVADAVVPLQYEQ
jgi:hypothetical protein